MKRVIFTFLILLFCAGFGCKAWALNAQLLENTINSNPVSKSSIVSVSVRNLQTGGILYQKNSSVLARPASTLKFFTSAAALDFLGLDYKFITGFWKDANTTYLKVSGDPLFDESNMFYIISQLLANNYKTTKDFVIDDTIIDKIPYGVGWYADDNASGFFPQMSPYIINRNLFCVRAEIVKNKIIPSFCSTYHEPTIVRLKVSKTDNYNISRDPFSKRAAVIEGEISQNTEFKIPALNTEEMFKSYFFKTLQHFNLAVNPMIKYEKTPRFSYELSSIYHTVKEVLYAINKRSDNLAAEILLKHLGAVSSGQTGSTKNGLERFKLFYQDLGVYTEGIIVADASGASMNNLLTSDWQTKALCAISKTKYFNELKSSMATPSDGTFSGRLGELDGKLNVKTGTLSNTSTVAGYITTQDGEQLAFSIMLDNLPEGAKPKEFENNLIRAIYSE